jgi:dolichol-phosphate mannosyltransferase
MITTADIQPKQRSTSLPYDLGPEVTVVIPTRNERDNIVAVYSRLCNVLKEFNWEVIFVDDDSTDGSASIVTDLAHRDRRVRLIHRIGRRGLSSACIEGVLGSTSPYVAVMDADLQHDERLLPKMIESIRSEPIDIIVGSRYMADGSIGSWNKRRVYLSKLATRVGRSLLQISILDPMSGFFIIRREAFQAAVRNMSAIGFKILMDIIASSPRTLRVKELPYTFRPRHAGESKLDNLVALQYLILLLDKLLGGLVPIRFVLFVMVGVTGVITHLISLFLLLIIVQIPFSISQAIATVIAMVGNFTLNNLVTYRDQRLSGIAFAKGLVSFVAICGIGAVANVGVANLLYGEHHSHWLLSGLAGAAMSAVWNYCVTAAITWRARQV